MLWKDATRATVREGLATAQELFDASYGAYAEDDPYWSLVIGDPGPDQLFDWPVYERGEMTLHQLRVAVGDAEFFRILRTWSSSYAGGNVNTDQFIALAERISGQRLDDLFDAWVYTGSRPVLAGSTEAQARAAARAAARIGVPVTYVETLHQLQIHVR